MTSAEAVQVVSELLAKNAEAGYEFLTDEIEPYFGILFWAHLRRFWAAARRRGRATLRSS